MTTQSNWKILGVEESDGECCECCGASCPKRRIVLTNGEGELRFGSSCAAYKLMGSKKSGDVKVITEKAKVANLAKKWLVAGHSIEIVAKGIRNRFGYTTIAINGGVDISSIGFIS